jgi:MoaA/NifB/PqqE/SkfB family radical SAM enzyme
MLEAHRDTFALWCTYHPTEVSLDHFLRQCDFLYRHDIRHSVGVVGIPAHADEIRDLRRRLPQETYLWINAYKSAPERLDDSLAQEFARIDRLFPINHQYHPSFGKACRTGLTSVTIDGQGDVRRCHFIDEVLGNIYNTPLESMLLPRVCTKQTCGCHIGYVNLEELGLENVFGASILERVPKK